MRQIILVSFIFASIRVIGQTKDSLLYDTTRTVIEVAPTFPGGTQNIYKLIEDNLHYPESALKDKVGGKVFTQFVVDTLGNVINIEVIKGVREDIDNEAMRLIGLLNGWTPGTQDGRKVKVRYVLPLTFFPNNKWKRKYKRL
jgi:TonB family protein